MVFTRKLLGQLLRPSPYLFLGEVKQPGEDQKEKHDLQACALARQWLETPFIVDGVVVMIDDVDTHFGRAKRGGAKILSEPETNERQRQYRVEDLEGHRWMFAQRLGS